MVSLCALAHILFGRSLFLAANDASPQLVQKSCWTWSRRGFAHLRDLSPQIFSAGKRQFVTWFCSLWEGFAMLRLAVSWVVVATCCVLLHVSQGAEIVPTPVVRDVLLNLTIDDLKTQTPVQLKRMSNGVLAQGIKPLPEALQFEVVVKGAHPDIPVLFPVPKGSPVCRAYEEFINTDPDKVLASLGLVKMPTVRVVAVRATYVYEAYDEGELKECKPTCEWLPSMRSVCPPRPAPSRSWSPCRSGTRSCTRSPNAW
jgi:hypothetical protein